MFYGKVKKERRSPQVSGHGEKLTRSQERVIALLLTERSIQEAAEKAGIADRTLRRWLRLDSFKIAYREAKAQVVDHAIAKVQKSMGEAVETLTGIMINPEALASARVSAAKAIIDMGLKAAEIERLEARICIIEKEVLERRKI